MEVLIRRTIKGATYTNYKRRMLNHNNKGAGRRHSSDELFSTQHEFTLSKGEQKGGGVGGGVRKKESTV